MSRYIPSKNIEYILSFLTMQKQVVDQMWPAGRNLRPPELEHVTQKYFLNFLKSEYFFEFFFKNGAS